jgi:pseudaminic acid synthase
MKGKKIILKIGRKIIGHGQSVFIVAEISANHLQNLSRAKKLVELACRAGADAVKIQTYTPDTLTLNSSKEQFQIKVNTAWKGRTLYQLYKKAYMPWEWYGPLEKITKRYGKILFSTAYDDLSVDFLEKMNTPVYKIASFELPDVELLKKVAKTKKPVIISRGMASLAELSEAISVLKRSGAKQIAVLHCVSSYPAKPEEMNLKTVPDIAKKFKVVSGLSDHSLTISAAVASVALGANIIEKHFTLRRADGGFDAAFSLEPKELKEMIKAIRETEKAIGKVSYKTGKRENENKPFRRSLWAVRSVKKGEKFTLENVGRFRPGHGLPIKFLPKIFGKKAKKDIDFATPLEWSLIGK